MNKLLLSSSLAAALVLSSTNLWAETLKGKYELQSSSVNYVVTYLIKKAEGTSTSSKGKGDCSDKGCEFLVAAPVKSFESKDSNRDLNMLKVTKAEKFPLVVAKIKTATELGHELKADIEIDFAGEKHLYKDVVFKTTGNASAFHGEGKFDILLGNHKIERPSLMGVSIKDNVPLTITADWKKL
ncbi:MAG: hypothetical protein ACXVLQ_09690 [Bacteriovorax sp.]